MALDYRTINLNALISKDDVLQDMKMALLARIESGESDRVEINGKSYRLVPESLQPGVEEVPYPVLWEKLRELFDRHTSYYSSPGPTAPPTEPTPGWADHTHFVFHRGKTYEVEEAVGTEHIHVHSTQCGLTSPPIELFCGSHIHTLPSGVTTPSAPKEKSS